MIPHTDPLLAIVNEVQRDRRQQADHHRLVRQARQAHRSWPDVVAAGSWAPARWSGFRRLRLLSSFGS